MRYARQFSAATQRTIELDGQALFTVATHDGAPFIVTSRGLEARVLGTTFGVRHYAGDRAGLVIVYSGKVSASGGRTAVPLTAGMQATVMDSTVVASTVADTGEMVDWTHGQLVFRRVPVATVLGALERWYGNQFQLEDTTLARRPVTATFAMDDRAEMLRIVRHVLEVDMTFDGSTVMLQPTRDARHHGTGDQRRKDNYPTSTREVGR